MQRATRLNSLLRRSHLSTRSRWVRPGLEALECRALLSTAAPVFTTIDFKGAGPGGTQALGINSEGDVVGLYYDGQGYSHGFLQTADGKPPITIDDPETGPYNILAGARAINAQGQIVGFYGDNGSPPRGHGYFRTTLGEFAPIDAGGLSTDAQGVDDGGQVVGWYKGSDQLIHGFFGPHEGEYSTIDVTAGVFPDGGHGTYATGVNDSGQIVGDYGETNAGTYRGFRRSADGKTFEPVNDPYGALGTFPQGINNAGEVVGYYEDASGRPHGFVASADLKTYTTIDAPNGGNTYASGINSAGQVVGYYFDGSTAHGFLSSAPTLSVASFQWNVLNGGVEFDYEISKADLPQATTVAVYWAKGTSFDSVIGSPVYSTTTDTAQGSYGSFRVSMSELGKPPQGAAYLLAVADPLNTVEAPNTPGKIASLVIPDLVPHDLVFDDEKGGIDISYNVVGRDLPRPTTIGLYWATSKTFDTVVGDRVATIPVDQTQGNPMPVHLYPDEYGTLPSGARFLLAVANPSGEEDGADAVGDVILRNSGLHVTALRVGTEPGASYTGVALPAITRHLLTPVVHVPPAPDKTLTDYYQLQYAGTSVDFATGVTDDYSALCAVQSNGASLPVDIRDATTGQAVTVGTFTIGQVTVTVYSGPDAAKLSINPADVSSQLTVVAGGKTYQVSRQLFLNDTFLNDYSQGDAVMRWQVDGVNATLAPAGGVSLARSSTGPLTYWIDLDKLGINPAWHSFDYILRTAEPLIHNGLLYGAAGHLAVVRLLSAFLVIFDPGTTDLLITGPGGEQTGMTDAGQVVNGIPGSAYFPSVPLAIIAIPIPGAYQIRVRGRAAGGYILESALSTESQVSAQQTSTGTLAPGQTAVYSMTLDPSGTSLTTVPTVAVPPPSVPPPSGFGAGRDAFVLALYREILGRTPEPRGLRYWSGLLFAGARPGVVAQAIWESPEHAGLLLLHVAPAFTFKRALSDARKAAARAT